MDDLNGGGSGPQRPRRSVDSTTVGVLVALVVILAVAVVGVVTVRDAEDTIEKAIATTTTAPGAAEGPAPGATGGALSPEQQRVVEEIKGQVSAIRGLAWQRELPVTVLSKEQLSRRVKELNAEDLAENRDEIAADESVLKLLQLIPRNLDYAKTIDDVLAGGVLGYYDDESKELFVGGGGAGPIDVATQSVLAHELTHALTDQHFAFGPATRALEDQEKTEEESAYSAVIEGDAELVRTMWEEKHLTARQREAAARGGAEDGGAYDKAPPYLLNALFFPYDAGLTFVEAQHRAGGFAAVDDAYRAPPTSTEQILHPELYAARQGWAAPGLPDLAAGTGCGPVDTGTLGEFDMGQLLARHLSLADSRRAAAGWNGDAYGVVRCGAAVGFAQRWQTDDPADAGRLADALARWSRGWSGSGRDPDGEGRFSGPKGSGRLSRSPGRVELVLADDVATTDRLARALTAA